MKTAFTGGRNIAMKVPPHQFDATVRFYRDVLGLEQLQTDTPCFTFGAARLWIDSVDSVSQAEIWLQVVTDDVDAAAKALQDADVVRCDTIEALPQGFDGFWISSPASIIHLVSSADA